MHHEKDLEFLDQANNEKQKFEEENLHDEVRLNPNKNKEEISGVSKKNQLR